ncbi:MAG TPA: MotA/TolQ/ExbB proton channel family protein [Methylophilaceae bacterium]|nr:MotA/TolQ/ExbB proton channel family protein [Methylophilaceae bacterium]
MQNGYEFDSLAFIASGGPVSIGVAVILLVMSLASWYLIVVKAVQITRLRRASARYSKNFWDSSSLDAAMQQKDKATPVSRLVNQAVDAAEHHERHAGNRLADVCSQDEFIARAMRRSIGNESAHLEYGLTVLASVGSVAPFVGLFGTVWGIYHALASISVSGQATLDKVAGPVGEALIMTALGLAVAIPAVLAYNALVRSNRVLMAQIESFAHDLHTLLTTGAPLGAGGGEPRETAAHKQHVRLKDVSA